MQGIALGASSAEGLLLTALPVMAVTVTTDPRSVSLVTAASQAPWLVLPLAVGVAIDHVRKSSLLGAALGLQTAGYLGLALAVLTHTASLPVLMAVACAVVVGQVVGEGTRGALVPWAVGPAGLDAANARLLFIDVGVVRFLIPPLAGFLVVWRPDSVGWAAFVTSVPTALLTKRLRTPVIRPPVTRLRPVHEVRLGLRHLVGSRLLRSITIEVLGASFAWFMGYATLALYVEQYLRLDRWWYGVLLACTAVGFAAAAPFSGRLVTRLGHPTAMRAAIAGEVTCKLLLGVVPAHWAAVGAVLAVHSFATFVWNVGSQSSRQRFTPPELLGRVLTSHRALSWGVAPLGAAAGGIVAATWGFSAVWVGAATVQAVGAALVWRCLSARAFDEARLSPLNDESRLSPLNEDGPVNSPPQRIPAASAEHFAPDRDR
ncbi:MFS transporter [Streptomyces fuscichromogenes]|uniref:MFS transporter n=1 Tax=Streptomyces fuscichromogenes TaxID=1324013 RepID=A0A917UH27_9ACTN|nr:MFS transporter [Streptomyces fuscichromogenes]